MRILIRADASIEIGSGHIMRTLALAMALLELGAEITYVTRTIPGNLLALLESQVEVLELPGPIASEGLPLVDEELDAAQTLSILGVRHFDWCIVDNYRFGKLWESKFRECCGNIMAIDDLADRIHDVDLLLDVNLHDKPGDRYQGLVAASTCQLLGPAYSLLRSDFANRRAVGADQDPLNRDWVSVVFGGADKPNLTQMTAEALRLTSFHRFKVVTGPSYPHLETLTKAIGFDSRFEVLCNPANFAEVLAGSRLSLGSGGGLTWERCCLGVPAIVVSIADNQTEVSRVAMQWGVHRFLGDYRSVSVDDLRREFEDLLARPDELISMAKSGQALVDGRGVMRVVSALRQF